MRTTFGQLLRKTRKKSGKSMGDVARFLGLTVPYISDVERDRRAPFPNHRISQLAGFLGVDPDPLLVAAAQERGAFELDARVGSTKAHEVGVALMRSWSDLTDKQFEEIQEIIRSKRVREKV